jgi:hypothetical protein
MPEYGMSVSCEAAVGADWSDVERVAKRLLQKNFLISKEAHPEWNLGDEWELKEMALGSKKLFDAEGNFHGFDHNIECRSYGWYVKVPD